MIDTVYILGNHIQALGLSRLAAKAGLRVEIFNDKKISIARYSNSCSRFHLFREKTHLMELLRNLANGKKTLLLATNDSLIDFLNKNHEELSEHYELSIPSPESVEICYNKRRTYLKAKELGIPIPDSLFPDSYIELEALSADIKYPVILKPAVMHTFHSVTGKKVIYCANREELLASYRRITEIIPPSEVIVQEFLKGGARVLYSYGSFAAGGRIYGSLSANRIRQNPMDFGNSTCYAVTVAEPVFEEYAIRFLKAINYFGMSEVEFMKDPETGEFRLLEINPRAWKWHSIANKLDINFLKMMVDYLDGKTVQEKHNKIVGIAWIERLTDCYIVLNELVHGRMKSGEYLASMRAPKESAVWSLKDPLPAIMYILFLPFLFIQR